MKSDQSKQSCNEDDKEEEVFFHTGYDANCSIKYELLAEFYFEERKVVDYLLFFNISGSPEKSSDVKSSTGKVDGFFKFVLADRFIK